VPTSTPPYLFGDLLALAGLSWVRQMAERLSRLGYPDNRRSDAAALRLLRRGPVPVGRLGAVLGVTRQAARKVADGLVQRDYARTERDAHDARVLNVVLTAAGIAYAQAVTEVIHALNHEFRQRVDPAQLAAADAVLRAVLAGDSALRETAAAISPPGESVIPD
jgi:DNA-binding MarR family transcriptional regulator